MMRASIEAVVGGEPLVVASRQTGVTVGCAASAVAHLLRPCSRCLRPSSHWVGNSGACSNGRSTKWERPRATREAARWLRIGWPKPRRAPGHSQLARREAGCRHSLCLLFGGLGRNALHRAALPSCRSKILRRSRINADDPQIAGPVLRLEFLRLRRQNRKDLLEVELAF